MRVMPIRHAALLSVHLVAAWIAGCSSTTSGTDPIQADPCSVLDVPGTIAGVTISISSSRCIYRVGEAAEFTYEVKTTAGVPPIEMTASPGCGSCTDPGENPLSFTSYNIGGVSSGGAPQNYCVCDTGCCAPDQAATIQVLASTESAKISWSGRNWNGPSDTSNPQGEFFEPGNYGVNVTFNGRAQGSVTATLPIEIVP
jgi:hypothetical protein